MDDHVPPDAQAVILVEGTSDRLAIEALARRRGRDLLGERITVVSMGGATNIGQALGHYGPTGRDLRLAGLVDIAEAHYVRRGLARIGLDVGLTATAVEPLGFFTCDADLEDELIRSLGTGGVVRVIAELGELDSFHRFQKQPVPREWSLERQLRRFMGTRSGRKERYGSALVNALDLDRIPVPLDRVLAHV